MDEHTIQRTTVSEVENTVDADMRRHAYGNTPGLIDAHFGSNARVNDIVEGVYKRLLMKRIYVPERSSRRQGHWVKLPLEPDSEDDIYEPLTDVLNAITQACKDLCKGAAEPGFDLIWRDEHKNRTESLYMADAKPDIVATFRMRRVWWRSIQTLIQVKTAWWSPWPAAVQLLRYVRQVLREQPDRRFIYGMVFSFFNLTLWHVDRTGALASEVINIHKDPKTFIRIIVGFLLLTRAELGWDPTMQRYSQNKATGYWGGVPSYTIDEDESAVDENAYGRMWIVDMPKPDSPTVNERFVLFHSIYHSLPEVVRGRATRIWRAWKLDDMDKPAGARPVYVFKDYWREDGRPAEGDLYKKAGNCAGVAAYYSHSDVQITNGNKHQVDSTLVSIRKNVRARGKALKLKTQQVSRCRWDVAGDSRLPLGWAQDQFAFEEERYAEDRREPPNMIHSRLVTSSFGHHLEDFRHLPELLGGFYDAINGHKNLYEKGILHRDISTGNIILTGLPAPNRALIIDLDRSIERVTDKELSNDNRNGTPAYMSSEILECRSYYGNPSLVESDLSDDEDLSYTIPQKPYIPVKIRHDAVHDLESFFWVLCWLCTTSDGPGKFRNLSAKGLDAKDAEKARQISHNIVETFNAPVASMALHKRILMLYGSDFRDITSSFSPYFRPLITFVLSLRRILQEAYKSRNFDGLHDKFLHAFKVAEEATEFQTRHDGEKNAMYKAMEEAVTAQRSEEWRVPGSPRAERVELGLVDAPVNSRKRGRQHSEMTQISQEEEGVLPATAPPPPKKKTKTKHAPTADQETVSQSIKTIKTRYGHPRAPRLKNAK